MAFLGVLYATLVIAFAAYLLLLRKPPTKNSFTIIAVAAALVAGLFWLPLFSSDIYAYAAYGEITRLGGNPYAPILLSRDAVVSAAQWQWGGSLPPCVYGASFVAMATAVVAALQQFPPEVQLDAFRVLSCIAFIVCVYCIAKTGTPDDRARGVQAAMLFGLNPVVLWSAIEGHNDTLMLAVALAGIALYRRNANLGTFLATLAGSIKAPGILVGAVVSRNAGAFAGVVVVALTSIPLLYGVAHNLAPHGHYAPFASAQSIHPFLAALLAVATLFYLRRVQSKVDRLLVCALAAWLFIPNPYPWYTLWLLPLAAWATDTRLATATIIITSATLLRYIPDAISVPQTETRLILGIAAIAGYAVLVPRAQHAR